MGLIVLAKNAASQILVLTVVAFWFWLGLLWMLRKLNGRGSVAVVVAAILSWVGATASLAWVVAVLRRAGLWPLV